MHIKLLGPLEVTIEGTTVPLGGHKQQSLLAYLAIHANEELSPDRCIHAVWGESPPDGAGHSLQTYVSNLRKLIEPNRDRAKQWTILETTSSGNYRLNIAPDQLDVAALEDLINAAAEAAPTEAMELLAASLKIWRGRPLGDFADEHWARTFVSRTTELHIEAIAAEIDARLATGRDETVIADLEGLVENHPLKERFWGQLMLALYRHGRQADSLRAFGRLKAILGDELGIEPSASLQELEQQILMQEPTLDRPVATRSNLPAAISTFVGRTEELAQLESLLADSRLVTITGAPGAGKTRTAYELAGSMLSTFPDGVWCFELAPLRDGELIVTEMISELGLNAPVAKSPIDALCDQVADWRALFVMDNCEHLLAAAAQAAGRVLRAGSDLKVLATSRRSLDISGEVAWRLPPLQVPKAADGHDVNATDSTRLFAARARSAQPDIDLASASEGVIEVCRRLDGLPLAIELTAARVRSMTVAELLERLEDRFRLLSRGDPTAVEHQQTLRATVDWSYELLTPREQEVYRRLSVFRGGWVKSAAEAVGSSADVTPDEVFDLVDGLIANSLVLREVHGGESRFRMLETMRDHGIALLEDSGVLEETRDAHLRWVASVATEAESKIDGPDQKMWLARLNAEIDNLRAAFDWGLSGGDEAVALDAASRIPRFWWLTSEIAEGADWMERLLAANSDASPVLRARGLSASGFLINMLGRSDEATSRLNEAVTLLRDLDEEVGLAWALNFLGRAAWDIDTTEALRGYQQEAASLFAKHGLGQGVFLARIMDMAVVAFRGDDPDEAVELAEGVVAMAESVGAPNALAHAYESRAWGRLRRFSLGAQDHGAGFDFALDAFRAALPHYRELGNQDCGAHCLSGVAHGLAVMGRFEEAAELMGAVDALLESLSVVPPGYERFLYDTTSGVLGDREAEARASGRRLNFVEAIDRALEMIS